MPKETVNEGKTRWFDREGNELTRAEFDALRSGGAAGKKESKQPSKEAGKEPASEESKEKGGRKP